MTDLIRHAFGAHAVRTFTDEHGEPWFVLRDLLDALGITRRPAAVVDRLDSDGVRQTYLTDALGRQQETYIVSESGMYEVIVRSDSPAAVPFRRWVTTEVLPSIRRTGSYGAPALPDLTTAAGVLTMATLFAETAARLVASEAQVEALAPRAEVADRMLDATGDLSVADAAKALCRAGVPTGRDRLYTALADLGWTYRAGDGRWHVKQAAIEAGRMGVIPQSHYHPRTGELVADAPQPRVTHKGVAYLMGHLSARGQHLAVVTGGAA